MVRAQKLLLDHLGVSKLFAVVGGSMGGMQALQWIVEYPDFSEKAIIIAATAQRTVQTIAFNEAGRRSIVAIQVGKRESTMKQKALIRAGGSQNDGSYTYLSDHGMEEKFGGSKGWILTINLNSVYSDI